MTAGITYRRLVVWLPDVLCRGDWVFGRVAGVLAVDGFSAGWPVFSTHRGMTVLFCVTEAWGGSASCWPTRVVFVELMVYSFLLS